MNEELRLKLGRVRHLLAEQGAEAALLGLTANFSWLSCGAEAHVPLTTDRACAQLLVTAKELFILANRIEMPRLQGETIRGLGARPLVHDWFDNSAPARLAKVVDPRRVLSDCDLYGTSSRPELFHPLHYSLLPVEVRRLERLGRAAEEALRETCHRIQPGWTEMRIAGTLSERCRTRNLTATVLLIATDARVRKYRHPQATRRKLERYAMLVLCARQHGLIVALSRLVHFGRPPRPLRERHEAVCRVDTAFHLATQVGTPVREIFQHGVKAYAREGFPNEWKLHHQGGPCGYQGRDYLGSPTAPGVVLERQPFAWNPSITGTKSEDTILATRRGPKVITIARDWPMVTVERADGTTWHRPDILVR